MQWKGGKWERASVTGRASATQRERQMEVERQWVRQIEVHHSRLSLSLYGTPLPWHTNQMAGISDSYLQGWCSVFRWKERLHLSRQSSAHCAQAHTVILLPLVLLWSINGGHHSCSHTRHLYTHCDIFGWPGGVQYRCKTVFFIWFTLVAFCNFHA